MLTKLERNRIIHRESLTTAEKKNLTFRLRKKLIELKQTFEDINNILNFFPHEELHAILDFEHLSKSLDVTESLFKIVDPLPVGWHEAGERRIFRVWGTKTPNAPAGKCLVVSSSYTATQEEIASHERLKDYLSKIRKHIDPCFPDSVCRDYEYTGACLTEIQQRPHQNPYSWSFDSHADEIGISENGVILRESMLIDIKQLPQIRVKPRGLSECLELPPILEEKKVLKTGKAEEDKPK